MTDESNKAREFFIDQGSQPGFDFVAEAGRTRKFEGIHVIEKSAYDTLAARLREVEKQVSTLDREKNALQGAYSGVLFERDELRAELASHRNPQANHGSFLSGVQQENIKLKAENARLTEERNNLRSANTSKQMFIEQIEKETRREIRDLNEEITALKSGQSCAGCEPLRVENERLKDDLENERIRLAGCGVAALLNTEETVKNRIAKDNPYYSASYSDVCRAVDREISLRTLATEMRDALKFYGDKHNWEGIPGHTKWASNLKAQDCALLNCGGGRARLVIEKANLILGGD